MPANEVCQHPKVRGYLDFFCSSQVLTMFSSSSQWVPNMFLKLTMCSLTCSLPCSQLHFTFSHMLCPILFSWNLYRWANIETYVSMFGANTFKLGSLQSLRICLGWANQRGSCNKTKFVLGRHLPTDWYESCSWIFGL